MKTKQDMLPVSLRQLDASAYTRHWVKVGLGVQIRARRSATGYDLRIQYGANNVTHKASIQVGDFSVRKPGVLRRMLMCCGCGKPATKRLYLSGDFRFRCAKCLGVPQWKIRIPPTWDLGEEVKFRQLLKRKVDQDILKFEIAALKALTPEEFFASRPYLVPEFVDDVKPLDPMLHKKLLFVLHRKYKSVMKHRHVRMMSEKESDWLLDMLGVVLEKSFIITKREITWLTQQRVEKKNRMVNGIQGTSMSEPLGSLPLETGCSSPRMSSSLGTSVNGVEEMENTTVATVTEQELSEVNSSVPPAMEKK
jgi:hypothetical protein